MHVRNCRMLTAARLPGKAPPSQHPLCSCAQSQRLVVGGVDAKTCVSARSDICGHADTRGQLRSMCIACASGPSVGGANNMTASSLSAAECRVQTVRATGFVMSRGLCSALPSMDCSSETMTLTGVRGKGHGGGDTSDAVEYQSLGPALGPLYFANLGDSLGGYGWYWSSPMA